ncbi:MAG: hypothetical protein K6G68_08750 [Oscillospiraceae bacterium]|nr:hypothetical protein [Oscillospiraceae bacterium]
MMKGDKVSLLRIMQVFILVMAITFTSCGSSRSMDIHRMYDEIIVNSEWPQMDMITDDYILSTRFLIEDTSQFENIMVMQCPASAVRSEIILIKTDDVRSAYDLLEQRREKAIDRDSLYPEDKKIAERSIVGTVGDTAYFLMGESAEDAEKIILEMK